METNLIIRDWTIEIKIVFKSEKPITDYIQRVQQEQDSNEEFEELTEESVIEALQEDAFMAINSYFHSFAFFPCDGCFLANEFNAPLFLLKRFINGFENRMVFICVINEEIDEDPNPLYAFRHLN